ncbi:hypothetical protein VL20_6489 [Microcystis panniformis FACHB-1757]|uniref:Uncharacterized protein n=1 Tax=Microcystis panniformis FACHB-1757 TaxID=1638788 RepID=A0A0K1SAZ4_9CHRO|nr:hypothetical protein VL20_6489 [Microcystis panniformis FACHB-1757]
MSESIQPKFRRWKKTKEKTEKAEQFTKYKYSRKSQGERIENSIDNWSIRFCPLRYFWLKLNI